MSADMQDMIAKLQMQQALQSQVQPNFMGLQSAQDPNVTAALVKRLQDQAYVSQQGNSPNNGGFGMINDQSKRDFARAGQGLAGLLGIGQPAPIDNSAVMQQRQAITGANNDFAQSQTQPGADPRTALIPVLQKLQAAGVPGAADMLEKAQDALNKQKKDDAETLKNIEQSKSYAANALNQQNEQSHRLASEDFERQRIALETQRLGIERTKTQQATDGPDLLAPPSPGEQIIAQKMADGDMKLPDPGSRSKTAARYAALALQINPDLTQEMYGTRQKALAAITSGPQGNQVRSFNVAYNHLDTVNQAVAALQGGDLKGFNNIANRFQTQTGGAKATDLDTALAMVKGELGKAIIGTHPPEGMVSQMLAGVTSASSPEQLIGAANVAKDLMLGQASGVKQQFGKSVMGKHFNFDDALTPAFKKDLNAYEAKLQGADTAAPAAGTQQQQPPQQAPAPQGAAVPTYNPKTGKFEQ